MEGKSTSEDMAGRGLGTAWMRGLRREIWGAASPRWDEAGLSARVGLSRLTGLTASDERTRPPHRAAAWAWIPAGRPCLRFTYGNV